MTTYGGVQVIGAGTGRTGTSSLKRALEILGYPCYHMEEVMKHGRSHCDFWYDMGEGKKRDFKEVFEKGNYTATCDFPSCVFWREQLQAYPGAKVILSIRDPEKWLKSCNDTIFTSIPTSPLEPFGIRVFRYLLGMGPMLESVIAKLFAKYDWSHDNLIKQFKAHNQAVIDECSKDKLLVFEVSQGWEPLCKFLDKPIPDVPFPNVNDTKEFRARIDGMNMAGYVIAGMVAVCGIAAGWFGSRLLRKHFEL